MQERRDSILCPTLTPSTAHREETSRRRGPVTAVALFVSAMAAACDDPTTTVIAISTAADGPSGSLRAAIDTTNAADPRQPVRIELPAGTYDLTLCSADDANSGGDLDITSDADVSLIAASGATVVIRQTCPDERVLDAHGTGRLTLSGVTITGGRVQGTEQLAAQGGGVRAQGDVNLERATISGNTALSLPYFAQGLPAAQGGGLYVGGALASVQSAISGNRALGTSLSYQCCGAAEGGGAYVVGAIWMSGGSVSNNSALGVPAGLARGGGVAQASGSTGAVVFDAVSLGSNTAEGGPSTRDEQGTVKSAGEGIGGAIAAFGPLWAANLTATDNTAIGGDALNQLGHQGAGATGGAIASQSTAEIRSSTFSGNRAESGDALVYTATQSQFTGPARGGAVWANGDLRLSQSSFDRNTVRQGGGYPRSATRGGAVRGEGALTVTGGQFRSNTAGGSGGGLSGGAVSLTDVTFTGNTAFGRDIQNVYSNEASGGAVDATTLSAQRVRATDNRVDRGFSGGALFVAGDATLENSAIQHNLVTFAPTRNNAPMQPPTLLDAQGGGGGARVVGKLVISNSMLLANGGSAIQPSIGAAFVGGGAWAGSIEARNVTAAENYALGLSSPERATLLSGGGAFASTGTVTLVNATLSGNLASVLTGASGHGAAILAGSLTLEHVTALDNEGVATIDATQLATAARGSLASLKATSLTTRRSVVVAQAGSSVCAAGTQVTSSADSSYNWFSDASCNLSGTGDQQSATDLAFAGLADNSGPVQTRLPAAGSAVIDYIPASDCPTASDARGVTRPQGAACDVGAAEIAQ